VDTVILTPHELDRLDEVLDKGPSQGHRRAARDG
jgi:hypothetical protein